MTENSYQHNHAFNVHEAQSDQGTPVPLSPRTTMQPRYVNQGQAADLLGISRSQFKLLKVEQYLTNYNPGSSFFKSYSEKEVLDLKPRLEAHMKQRRSLIVQRQREHVKTKLHPAMKEYFANRTPTQKPTEQSPEQITARLMRKYIREIDERVHKLKALVEGR